MQRPLRATHRPVGVVRPHLAVSRRYRGRDASGERLCRGDGFWLVSASRIMWCHTLEVDQASPNQGRSLLGHGLAGM
jgi:hypothetical protein